MSYDSSLTKKSVIKQTTKGPKLRFLCPYCNESLGAPTKALVRQHLWNDCPTQSLHYDHQVAQIWSSLSKGIRPFSLDPPTITRIIDELHDLNVQCIAQVSNPSLWQSRMAIIDTQGNWHPKLLQHWETTLHIDPIPTLIPIQRLLACGGDRLDLQFRKRIGAYLSTSLTSL